jgi:hypothetical protein
MKTIELPLYGIKVTLDGNNSRIESELTSGLSIEDRGYIGRSEFCTLEKFILACAVQGVDILSPAFLGAIELIVPEIFDEVEEIENA